MATEAVNEPRVSRIREILNELVHQRQSLRGSASRDEGLLLEANRLSIVYWQAELSRALLAERGHRRAG